MILYHTVLGPESSSLSASNVMKEVSFIPGEPLRIDTRIPIAQIHRNIIRNPNTKLEQRVFYNGELLQTRPSKDVRLPSEVLRPAPKPEEMAIVVTLKLPRPIPEDEGVYETQLFVDISRLPSQTCLDYIDFVRTSDGLNLPNVLVGTATLQIRQKGTQSSGKVLISHSPTVPVLEGQSQLFWLTVLLCTDLSLGISLKCPAFGPKLALFQRFYPVLCFRNN